MWHQAGATLKGGLKSCFTAGAKILKILNILKNFRKMLHGWLKECFKKKTQKVEILKILEKKLKNIEN